MLKRLFDILVSLPVLIICSPVFLLISVWIKAEDGGTVFYLAPRIGRYGKTFYMIKFRTMVMHADKKGTSSTTSGDARITRAGTFLRNYKLDELPQFMNVLKGDMSVVGPRPQIEWAVKMYSEEEKKILTLRPGITDYASIRFKNESEILARAGGNPDKAYMELIHPEKMRLSLEYLRTQSFFTDLKIIFSTLAGIFRK
jgi:lipopolysaccharide/colanic/teichoic acid biosynthesis glycosyltransferase